MQPPPPSRTRTKRVSRCGRRTGVHRVRELRPSRSAAPRAARAGRCPSRIPPLKREAPDLLAVFSHQIAYALEEPFRSTRWMVRGTFCGKTDGFSPESSTISEVRERAAVLRGRAWSGCPVPRARCLLFPSPLLCAASVGDEWRPPSSRTRRTSAAPGVVTPGKYAARRARGAMASFDRSAGTGERSTPTWSRTRSTVWCGSLREPARVKTPCTQSR